MNDRFHYNDICEEELFIYVSGGQMSPKRRLVIDKYLRDIEREDDMNDPAIGGKNSKKRTGWLDVLYLLIVCVTVVAITWIIAQAVA